MSKVINFYKLSEEFGCFSNFSRHPITLKDQVWLTSEHYFQAQKFAGTKFESAVRKCDTPREAAEMGRDRALPLRPDWDTVRDDIMREAVLAKFSQHADIRDILLSTNDAVLVEHTEKDNYWGDGGDGSGQNKLGQILMEVREKLRTEDVETEDELTKLENEFEELVNRVHPLIESELDTAKAAIKRAVAIAEEHGVPFSSNVYVWSSNGYVPKSFHALYDKMCELDNDGMVLENVTNIVGFSPYESYSGELFDGWESKGWSSSSLRC